MAAILGIRIYVPIMIPFRISFATALFLGFTFSPTAFAADSQALTEARQALEKITAKHRQAKSVSLVFQSRSMGADGELSPATGGTLLSADSGKFRLEYEGGAIVSNGKTLWQYSRDAHQVVIADADGAGSTGEALLRFLQAKPLRASRQNGSLRVILDPASVGEGLDSLILMLDGGKVREVDTQDPAGNRIFYTVKSLQYGEAPGRKAFEFKAPKGVETVDMR